MENSELENIKKIFDTTLHSERLFEYLQNSKYSNNIEYIFKNIHLLNTKINYDKFNCFENLIYNVYIKNINKDIILSYIKKFWKNFILKIDDKFIFEYFLDKLLYINYRISYMLLNTIMNTFNQFFNYNKNVDRKIYYFDITLFEFVSQNINTLEILKITVYNTVPITNNLLQYFNIDNSVNKYIYHILDLFPTNNDLYTFHNIYEKLTLLLKFDNEINFLYIYMLFISNAFFSITIFENILKYNRTKVLQQNLEKLYILLAKFYNNNDTELSPLELNILSSLNYIDDDNIMFEKYIILEKML